MCRPKGHPVWWRTLRKYLLIVIDSGTEAEGNRLLRGLPWPGGLASTLGESRQKEVTLGHWKYTTSPFKHQAGAKWNHSGIPARSPGGSPSKSQATFIMCGFPTWKFAFSPKFMCVPKISTQYLSQINSKKDCTSWRDLVTPLPPDGVLTVQDLQVLCQRAGPCPQGETTPPSTRWGHR